MNTKQRIVLIGLIAIVLAMALFPPFQFRGANGLTLNLGYAWLFSPPVTQFGYAGSVNAVQLVAQWAGAIVVTVALFLLAKEK